METKGIGSFFSISDDQFKRMIAVFIALVTVLVAAVTYLQSDAASRDDQANRDSKRYAVESFGRQVSGTARVNFDESVAYQMMYEAALMADLADQRQEQDAARRFHTIASEVSLASPLLAPPYYDPKGTSEPDILRYEADVYLVEITTLEENFSAAWEVKTAWDYKANTYIIYITLLALSLFMFGLAATLSSPRSRWVFSGAGVLSTAVAVVASILLWSKPVFDLRQQGNAIADYAQGVGLAHQEQYEAAIESFDRALAAYPAYTNALVERAGANMELAQYDQAVLDYTAAINTGDKRAFVAGNLGWAYYLMGDFQRAIDMNRFALAASPDELWVQFDLGLSMLAAGQVEAAKAEYNRGMEMATRSVADAVTAGREQPAFLWWSLEDAASSLDDCLNTLDQETGNPPPQSIQNPDAVRTTGQDLLTSLKSLTVALEFTNKPPAGTVSGTISPLQISEPVYDDQGEMVSDAEPATEFSFGITEVALQFDYEGMQNGQEYLVKLYFDGVEDPSWRILGVWDYGASGSQTILLSYEYSDYFTFGPGQYQVELYIDQHLMQSATFSVYEE